MRDRLIELSKTAHYEWLQKEYNHETDKDVWEYVVDYFLVNGVVFIPCKVGDIVYQTDGLRIYELKILNMSFHKNKPYYETESIDFDDDAIGKSIFLTRQEAEKKSKEMQND